MPRLPLSLDELQDRIYSRIQRGDAEECWLWTGPTTKDGYARQGVRYVHRLVFEWTYGYAPDVVDHLCRNRSCQNPAHMESVSRQENTRRGGVRPIQEGDTCPKGHLWFEDDNLYLTRSGYRKCRACRREQMRRAS